VDKSKEEKHNEYVCQLQHWYKFFRIKGCLSRVPYTGEFIFEYVDSCIEKLGVEKVVQVVTDNAAKGLLYVKTEEAQYIFWSSCATHTLNLMLEDIGKLKRSRS